MAKLTAAEAQLRRMIDSGTNSLVPSMTSGTDASVQDLKGNFDLKAKKYYFTVASGTITKIDDADLNANLKTAIPVYLFGSSDFQSAYRKMSAQYPVSNSNWMFVETGIYGVKTFEAFDSSDVAVTSLLQKGDVVQVFASILPGGGTTTLCLIVQSSQEIAFGALVQNVQGGDKLGIVKIRETMSNNEAVYAPQNQNSMYFFTMSILGKTTSDSLPVQSEISGFQYNQNIVDIQVQKTIDKYNGFAFHMEFTTPQITLTFACGSLYKA